MDRTKRVAITALPGFCCLIFFGLTCTVSAAIDVSGLSDKSVYADSVTFTVNSETGWDYTAVLNRNLHSTGIQTDVAVTVNDPDYYELVISRVNPNTGSSESRTLRFIVRDSSRGSSETGLPAFTPYPPIDSAEAEFAGASLTIVTPTNYPMGLEIPVAARVNDATGNRVGVCGNVTAPGHEDFPIKLLRGVGSVFLPAAMDTGTIHYDAAVYALTAPKTITIEAAADWQRVSGTINEDVDWGPDARVYVDGALTVEAGATLTVGPGSVIKVDPGLEIAVTGSIIVNGSNADPVVFTAENRSMPWGGFLFEADTSVGDFNGTILTASGADSRWFSNNPGHGSSHRSEQCLFYLSNGADVSLTDCYLIDNHGQAGHGESSTLTMTRCLVQKCITTGQYNAGSVTINDSALIEFPAWDAGFADDDNDGLYLTGGAHSLTDTLVGWAQDDGIDAGSGAGGTVSVDHCWFESFYHEAMAWSGESNRYVDVTDSVAINAGQGIESGWGLSFVTATRCLSTANMVGARLGDNYVNWSAEGFLTVTDSLLLYNYRDVWGRAWFDDWSERTGQMNIQDNYLSRVRSNFPNNTKWDPANVPGQENALIPFLPTPAGRVGIGLAVFEDTPDLAELTDRIPVRLSSFSTHSVSVRYSLYRDGMLYDSGTVVFTPGQSLQFITFEKPSLADLRQFTVTLSDPVNADLTGCATVTYAVPYEINDTVIAVGDDWLYRKGISEPPVNWYDRGFIPDFSWLTGPTPIGYERSSGYESCLATVLTDMYNGYYSVYMRKTFTIDDPARLKNLVLGISYDDGYIAYLNGIPVHSQNPPDPVAYNTPLSTDHEGRCGDDPPAFDISAFIPVLVQGENVLAIQVHNKNLTSSDLIIVPDLTIVASPTPGDVEPNGKVDMEDLSAFSAAWQSHRGAADYNSRCDVAMPADGTIDMLDLAVLAANWLAGM